MKDLTKQELRKIHKQSLMTRDEMNEFDNLACFRCGSTFIPVEVTEFADGDGTPVCPNCSIDSVIPLDGLSQEEGDELIVQLNNFFF